MPTKSKFPYLSMSKRILFLLSFICLVLLFIGGPGYDASRSLKRIWDLGHIIFFAIFTYLLLTTWKNNLEISFLKQCILIIGITFFSGLIIECLQTLLDDRTPDIYDLIRNIIGSLFSLAFFVPSRRLLSKRSLRIFQFSILFILLISLYPLSEALIDEFVAKVQFPVLSDFETAFEIKRWAGDSKIKRDTDFIRSGKFSLKVHLDTAQYSGIRLKYFPNDWRNYDILQFSVFNPYSERLKIHCRVHDAHHSKYDNKYSDRFNKTFSIFYGWNDITIPMIEIANAPKSRKMDLSHIRGFGIFVVRLDRPKIIYIDSVRLVKLMTS